MNLIKRYGLLTLFALGGAGLVFYACQKYGIGLAPDSVGYVQVARDILAGRGISAAFVLQPPLYPVTLAVGGWLTRSDPVDAAVWLNALWFADAIFCAGVLFLRHLKFYALAVLGTFGVLAARPMVNVATTAYSEMLYIFLMLVAFLGLEFYFEKRGWRWLGVAIAATALACLTRYMGAALIGAGALAILAALWRERWRAALAAGGFTILSALPLGLWALRNVLISGEPFGARAASQFTLAENIRLALDTFGNWFVPNAFEGVFWVGVGLVGIVFLYVVVTRRGESKAEDFAAIAPIGFFVVIFVSLMLITATTTGYNRINTRLLSPLYVPALILLIVMVERTLNPLRRRVDRRIVNVGALGLVALLCVFAVQTNVPLVTRAAERGAGGYNTMRWQTSETIAYVLAHRAALRATVYSNGPDALFMLADVDAQSILPKYQYASAERAFDASQLRGSYPPEPATLVWFDNIERDDFLFSLDELKGFTTIESVAQLADGAVYLIEKQGK